MSAEFVLFDLDQLVIECYSYRNVKQGFSGLIQSGGK